MTTAAQMFSGLDAFLQPISSTAPAGELLRYEGTYDQIKEARREEPELSQGVWQREPKRADWTKVEELCSAALKGKSKDLQLALWLMEAWVQLDGFAGATLGLNLIEGLHERFWNTMFPLVDNLDYRIAQIEWLNEKLPARFSFIPISAPVDNAVFPIITYADWEAAQYAEQNAHRLKDASASDRIQLAQCQQSLNCSPPEFFQLLWGQLRDCATAAKGLEQILERCYGEQNPGLTRLLNMLEAIASVVAPFTSDALAPNHPEIVSVVSISDGPAQTQVSGISAQRNSIQSRNDAYRCLAEAAEFLSRTEPHSPVPYLIRRAIAWGSMELDELLPELLSNEGVLRDVSNLLQLHPQKK